MWIAYVDESGDSGVRGSRTYSLGCVLVRASDWAATFDGLLGFRRDLRANFGLRMRDEVKANFLIRGSGPFRRLGLSDRARSAIYRQHLRLVPKIELGAFAVVIDKTPFFARDPGAEVADTAWLFLLQRLERKSTVSNYGPILIIHDDGANLRIRTLARKARRAGTAGSRFGQGSLSRPFRDLLDDPVPRDSTQSFFLQLADLVAYSAFRRQVPPPPRPGLVVPTEMWDELGTSRDRDVNRLSGGPPGIVFWPQ